MKQWYKILLICLVLTGILALSGCAKQAQLTSEMTVEENGSGKRTIQIGLDKNLVKKENEDSPSTLKHLMEQYCPKELEWEVKERKEEYDLTLTLKFDSLEEYVQKAEALVGKQKIRLENTGKGLSIGFKLEEDVSAEDFLGWMKDALVKEKYIRRSDKDDLFRLEKTYFSYAGERQVVYNGKIRYQTMTDYDAEQIVILTQPGMVAWNRVIYLKFPSALMKRGEKQVQGFLKDRISEQTQMEWLTQDCVRLTFSADNRNEMSRHMELFFGQTTCKIEETADLKDVFSFNYQYEEYLNVEDFAPKTGSTLVYYYVKDASDGNKRVHSDGQSETTNPVLPDFENQDIQNQIQHTIETEGYHMILGQSLGKKSVFYNMDCDYQAKAIEVFSVVRDSTSVSRNITVMYDRVPAETHREMIKQDFESKIGKNGLVEILEEKEEYGVRVSQEGTWEELEALFESVYGGKDQVSYKRDKATLLTPSANGYMEEKLDFSSFLPEGCQPQLTYSMQFESGDTILKDTLDSTAEKMSQEQVIQSRKYTATVSGSSFSIQFTTQIKNLISMPLISLFAFIIAAALIWYLHGKRWKKIKGNGKRICGTMKNKVGTWLQTNSFFSGEKRGIRMEKWKEVVKKIKSKFHEKDKR